MEDDLAIPKWLIRTKENTPKAPRLSMSKWVVPESVKLQQAKKAKKAKKAEARMPVLMSVQDGDDTVGKIRKKTELDLATVQAALRYLVKVRKVAKLGRRYLEF